MNIKRAVLCGALLWVLIFFEVSILMFGFNLEGGTYYLVHFLLLAILALVCAFVYFNGKKIKFGFIQGLIVGLVFLVVGTVLDIVLTIPLFVHSYSQFYSDIYLWIGYIETLVFTGVVASLK
jgi:hypothetical protein